MIDLGTIMSLMNHDASVSTNLSNDHVGQGQESFMTAEEATKDQQKRDDWSSGKTQMNDGLQESQDAKSKFNSRKPTTPVKKDMGMHFRQPANPHDIAESVDAMSQDQQNYIFQVTQSQNS